MLATKGCPVGMSSRLRQAYVAAKLCHFEYLTTRARHSEATAACSSVELVENHSQNRSPDEQELIPTEFQDHH